MGVQHLRVTTRQVIRVYGGLGWRMDWLAEEISPDGVQLRVEANFPTWWGGPGRINRLQSHDCRFGDQVVYRLRASSWLPIPRTVQVTPSSASGQAVDVQFELPLGWTTEIEELPPVEDVEW